MLMFQQVDLGGEERHTLIRERRILHWMCTVRDTSGAWWSFDGLRQQETGWIHAHAGCAICAAHPSWRQARQAVTAFLRCRACALPGSLVSEYG